MIIDLNLTEFEVLIEWHKNKQWEYSKNENYLDAEFHKKRVEALINKLISM